MNPARIAQIMKRIGASCRKVRRRNVYVCEKGSVTATIYPNKVVIRVPGEIRIEYLRTHPYDVGFALERIEEASNADRADINFGNISLDLVLEYSLPEKLSYALKAFRKLANNDMYIALTNIDAELRFLENGKQVDLERWIDTLRDT